MGSFLKRQHGQTWDNVPTIDGSRWGFIGAMIGVFVVVVLFFVICIGCLCRRRKKNKRMSYAAQGSNLATTHPEPSFARPSRPAHQNMADVEDGNSFVASTPNAQKYATSSRPARSEEYGGSGYQGEIVHHDPYYGNQGYPHSQQMYQSSNYEQQPGEPEFEPVNHPATSSYSNQGAYQEGSASPSMHPSQRTYPSYQPTTYPQPTYPQESVHPQETYLDQTSYGQAYSSYPTETQEGLPAYPLSSVGHTHDLPKSRMGPPGT